VKPVKKILALASLAAVAGLGVTAGLAGSASATDANIGYIKQYGISYSSPSDATAPVHKGLPPGTPVDTLCVRKGQVLNDNPYWFLIEKDGDVGYVHRDDIAPPADVRSC
jgi:hypothetical protein